jgi:ATP-dependent helicase/nuclease subunit A
MKANDEQLNAINQTGNVLLQAGAGSGKTYVIVEHVIFLINKYIDETPWDDFFVFKARDFLSKIAVITFTRLAAKEVKSRLEKKILTIFEELNENHNDYKKWEDIYNISSSLNISTIHGLCMKLIKDVASIGISNRPELISSLKMRKKIEESYRLVATDLSENKLVLQRYLLFEKQFIQAIEQIENDATIKNIWFDKSADGSTNFDLDHLEISTFFSEIFKINEWKEILDKDWVVTADIKDEKKSWYQFLAGLNLIKSKIIPDNIKDFKEVSDFFKAYKYLRPPTNGEKYFEATNLLEEIKPIKKFYKDHESNIVNYYESFSVAHKWFIAFRDIYQKVSEAVQSNHEITFSDMEYIVGNFLREKNNEATFKDKINYLVVDEFQDTSSLQFEIISNLIGRDFSKLYVVGDIKQAIYGFRGGELGVFINCRQKVKSVLELKKNYRSLANIINFNNSFFEHVFSKKLGAVHIPFSYQEIGASEEKNSGIVRKLQVSVLGCQKDSEKPSKRPLSVSQVNDTEALVISRDLVDRYKNNNDEEICILYKKLSPAKTLIYHLIDNKIPFVAQFKVSIKEDPIFAIIKNLLSAIFTPESKQKSIEYIQLMLNYLSIDHGSSISHVVDNLALNAGLLGMRYSIDKALFDLGISNSNYKNNLVNFYDLLEIYSNSFEDLFRSIDDSSDNSYNFNYYHGNPPHKIVLMTIHASKGLEFDHVYLAGIHTNSKTGKQLGMFGKTPGSFKWELVPHSKEMLKTPQFILEEAVEHKKDISESQRLLYVATTRAKKSLNWVDLNLDGTVYSSASADWINYLRHWEEQSNTNNKLLTIESLDLHFQDEIKSGNITGNVFKDRPLFHLDPIGNIARHTQDHNSIKNKIIENSLLILPELSITKLSSLALCPQKFYIENICGISISDHLDLFPIKDFDEVENVEDVQVASSSKERGIEIHSQLSKILKGNLDIFSTGNFPGHYSSELLTILSFLAPSIKEAIDSHKRIISEENIKFDFWGPEITGIPDLVILDEGQLEIWDFKTGRKDSDKEKAYLFQLCSYAFAYLQKNNSLNRESIILKIVYLDELNFVEFNMSESEISNYLTDNLSKLNSLSVINESYCHKCENKTICIS